MKQAIRIRRLPATNTKPTRLSVKTTGGSSIIKSIEYFERIADDRNIETEFCSEKKYIAAAMLMREKLSWPIDTFAMGMFNDEIYVTFL